MINENFGFNEMRESDIHPRKRELSEMFLQKYLRRLPIFVTQYFKIYGIRGCYENSISLKI